MHANGPNESGEAGRDSTPPPTKWLEPGEAYQFENLSGSEIHSKFQQAPVDHFSTDRLPARSRRKAMLFALVLGFDGFQRFYLRRPALGWICTIWSKIGIFGGIILLILGVWQAGLVLLIGFPLLSWLVGIGDLVALATGNMQTDGMGKPLDP